MEEVKNNVEPAGVEEKTKSNVEPACVMEEVKNKEEIDVNYSFSLNLVGKKEQVRALDSNEVLMQPDSMLDAEKNIKEVEVKGEKGRLGTSSHMKKSVKSGETEKSRGS
eukprot:4571764-Ditylum_brightwellii.AAC.1